MSIRFQYIIYIVVIASLLTPTQSKAQAELYGISLKDTTKYKQTWESTGSKQHTYYIPGDLSDYPFDIISTAYFLESGTRSIFMIVDDKSLSIFLDIYDRVANKYGEPQVTTGMDNDMLEIVRKHDLNEQDIRLKDRNGRITRIWLVDDDFINLSWDRSGTSLHIAPKSLVSYIANYQGR